jgi:hypothetical protein
MLIVTALVFALIIFRAVFLQMNVAHSELIRREAEGVLSYEVRRRVCLEVVPSHVSEFPVPREVRTFVLRFAGVVLWRKISSIALPDEACEHLGDISVQEFDASFPPWLRLGQNDRAHAHV